LSYREGTVTTGAAAGWPVSASEKRIMRNVKVRLLVMSLSSIQYQESLYGVAEYVFTGAAAPE
jgi:hypothetical protein